MPPFDREAALKAAEKALKVGKVDAAIAEYIKVVEAQPRDWNSANFLGDLYVRAKKVDKGLEQYTRIADHLAEDGFYSKALALFKKILKLKPDDEYALLQSGDLAAKQGTLADAKQFFLQVAEKRKARGARRQLMPAAPSFTISPRHSNRWVNTPGRSPCLSSLNPNQADIAT